MKDILMTIATLIIGGIILVCLFKFNPWPALGKLLAHQITAKEFFKVLGKSVLFTLIVFAGIILLFIFT